MDWPKRVGAVIYDPFEDLVLMQWYKEAWSCFGDDCLENEKPFHDAVSRALSLRLGMEVSKDQLIGFGAFATTRQRKSAQYLMLHHEEFSPLQATDLKRRWFKIDDALSLKPPQIHTHTYGLLHAFAKRVSLEQRHAYRAKLLQLGLTSSTDTRSRS